MAIRCHSSLFRAASALALLLVLAGCTPGGQFDPTEIFNSDMFDSKTKLKGQREPLFPNGVPGTTTGVPADLVKGYQPPPDQTDADAYAQGAPAPAAATPATPVEKPKPKPKVAVGRPQTRSAKTEKPPSSSPTRIDIGAKGAPPQQPSDAVWPNSPPAAQQGRTSRVAVAGAERTGPAGRAAIAIDLAGSAAHGPDAACGGAVSRIKFAIGTVIRFDVAQAYGGQHVHPIVRSSVLERPPLGALYYA